MGSLYYRGLGVDQDYSEAVQWYSKAAAQGEEVAQFALAEMYYNGVGVSQDYIKAMQFYEQAAKSGHIAALGCLGLLYTLGNGVPQDYMLAYAFFSLASVRGEHRYVDGRDYAASKLSPGQLVDAQQFARKWQARG